ncbi:uncharacterized protein LOC142519727 [Primulina tabacum]|uniref:uncharacterized protein LOC142519727 n=1 Tax=Primulina tabacum TaxID=48773 RepID=UPI003F5A8D06
MPRSLESELEKFDPEIERTLRRRRQQQRLKDIMNRNESEKKHHEDLRVEDPRRIPMLEYAQPSLDGARPSIVRPTVRANQFEIKPAIIQMIQNNVQFGGNALDDPKTHIADFLEICDTFKFNGVSDDAVRLRLFSVSLCDKAKSWLNCLPVGSITTWEDMAKAFLLKYFPPSKTMKLRVDITTFSQFEQESLYEALERYKDLLRRCPHHEFPLGLVVQTFYYALISFKRTMIDVAACRNLLRKTAEEGYKLLEEMAASSYHPQSERNTQRRNARVHQVTDVSAVTAQLEANNRKIDSMNVNGTVMHLQEIFCEKCGGEHYVKDCQDSGPFYVNEEAPVNQVGIQNHPRNDPYSNTYILGWRQHPNFSWGGQGSQTRPQGGQQYSKQPMYRHEPRDEKSSLEQMISKFISATETRLQNQDVSIKGLENQIGQLAKMITSREPGTLPSNTKTNPKEQVKPIALRSGKVLEQEEKEKEDQREGAIDTSTGKSSKSTPTPTAQSTFAIPPPFPAALKKAKLDAQFGILANKRKLEDHMTVNLTENFSALVQNKIPPKLKDPGSFSIPCVIGDIVFHKALCDLGASINLMPLSVFKKLGLREPKPSRMSLQLADRSVKFRGARRGGGYGDAFDFGETVPCNSCYRIDAFHSLVSNYVQDALRETLEATLTIELREDELDAEKTKIVAYLNATSYARGR